MSDAEKIDLFYTRDMKPEDRPFILSTWLRGLRYGNDWFELIEAEPYYRVYQDVIESILNRKEVCVSVACLKEDEDVIIGYSVYDEGRLHWVYCKAPWRKIGIARSLMPKNLTKVSHITDVGRRILSKYPNITFNPFI